MSDPAPITPPSNSAATTAGTPPANLPQPSLPVYHPQPLTAPPATLNTPVVAPPVPATPTAIPVPVAIAAPPIPPAPVAPPPSVAEPIPAVQTPNIDQTVIPVSPPPTPPTIVSVPPPANPSATTQPAPLSPDSPYAELAKKYNININKPFFPVNTLRLFYLLIAQGLTNNNPEAVDKVNKIISKINAVIDTRNQALEDNQQTNPILEVQFCQNTLNDVLEIVNTPVIHHTFDLLFSDLYPLQENLLLALDKHLNEESLGIQDLFSILKIRAMDSVVYSTIIHQVILSYTQASNNPLNTPSYTQITPLHWQINLTMQINDTCDSIIHAKEDMENQSAPLINILKRVIEKPEEVKEVIDHVLSTIISQSAKLPFPQPLQGTIKTFNQNLIATIKQ